MEETNLKSKTIVENLQTLLTNISQRKVGHTMQAKIFRYAGYKGLAKGYKEYSKREWAFVRELMYRILYNGGIPKNEKKQATEIFEDPVKSMKYDLENAKKELVWLKGLAELFLNNDLTSYALLLKYYMYQERVVHFIEKQLQIIDEVGIKNYLTYRIDVNDEQEYI